MIRKLLDLSRNLRLYELSRITPLGKDNQAAIAVELQPVTP